MDNFGYRYRQLWTYVWTIWTEVDTNWVGVWTKLSYPMYKFLYIYNGSTIDNGFDAILCLFYRIFAFTVKYFDRQIYEAALKWKCLVRKINPPEKNKGPYGPSFF